ncbi:MAG TPA: hypothetical protein VGP08_26300 [Pyrinomonadaceae bacterium]|jgi:hypothetical protein|nr:hypothetical protein [Pyrinomonadaceae bacterium]
MMSRSGRRLLFYTAALAALAALALLLPAETLAQCPLCRAGLMDAGDKTARTMNLAIVVLLIPPVSIFCTIFAVAYKKRKGDNDEDDTE